MATLALSVAGAGLGSLTGIGAGTGWLVGSTLGRVFFPGDTGKGSRLADLKISGASYGASIPTLFGTMRLGGNVIWAAPLIVREKSSETGGKGGVSASNGQTAYEYFASFAIGFARGEVGELLKIWADGTVIYDAISAGETRLSGLNFRFYNGDETQLSDSIMEAEEGVGQVPAYRGLSYLVFDSLPLADYGNRIPNIEVLLTTQGVRHYPQITGIDGDMDASSVAYDPLRGHVYTYEVIGGVDKVRKIDLASLSVVQTADIDGDFPRLSSSISGFSLDRQGDFWIGSGFALLPGRKFSKFNSRAMVTEVSRELPDGIGALTYSVDIQATLDGSLFQVAGSQQNAQVVVLDQALNIIDTIETESSACSGAVRDAREFAWIALSGLASVTPLSDLQIVQVSMTAAQGLSGTVYGSISTIHTVPQSELTPLGGAAPEVNNITRLVGYLKDQRELVFQNDYRLFKWSLDSQTITATRDSAVYGDLSLTHTNDGQRLVYVEAGHWLIYLDAETLEEVEREDLLAFSGVSSVSQFVYDALSDSVTLIGESSLLQSLYLRRKSGGEADFAATLESLASAAGLSLSDVDISSISGSVPGYILNRPMSVQDALEPLMIAGNFDAAESGYQLKFNARKEMPDLQISEEDLLRPLSHRRLQESEMPGSVTLAYMAADGGHLAGTQSAKRSYAPNATMFGRNEVPLDLPLALNAGQAKAICQQSLYSAWSERHSLAASFPIKYLALDAADVVSLATQNQQVNGRLTQNYLGADLTADFEAVQMGATGLPDNTAADPGTGYSEVLIQRPSFAELFILDLPLLRDEDATGGNGSRYYFAMDGYGQNWRGAGLFVSDTGERYEQRGVIQSQMCWGVTMTALAGTSDPWQTDRTNTLTIRFLNGQDRLETVAQIGALNGANALLVGDEIINFSDITLQPDGSYVIHTLLRGRRGTESAINTHKVGERVLLLEGDRLSRAVMSLGFLNLPHHWKAVGAGQLIEEVPAQIKSLTGRDLKPYAPVHIKSERSAGTVLISWMRRSRMNRAGLSGDPPVSEASERYELCFVYGGAEISKYVTDERVFS
ncbi:MAG: phage tail protein, partial [Sneathiella sp.]|nr:phage tail protein [Sneathiella sp.]